MKNVNNETCENCGRVIGRLETPMVWQEKVVCSDCFGRLSGMRTIPPIPDAGVNAAPRRRGAGIAIAAIIGICVLLATGGVIWYLNAKAEAQRAEVRQSERVAVRLATEKAEAAKADAAKASALAAVQLVTEKAEVAKADAVAAKERADAAKLAAVAQRKRERTEQAAALMPYQLKALEALDQIGPDDTNADVIQLNKANAAIAALRVLWNSQGGLKVYPKGSGSKHFLTLMGDAARHIGDMQSWIGDAMGLPATLGSYRGPYAKLTADYALEVFGAGADPSKEKTLNKPRSWDYLGKVCGTIRVDFHNAYEDLQKAQHEIVQAKAILSKSSQ